MIVFYSVGPAVRKLLDVSILSGLLAGTLGAQTQLPFGWMDTPAANSTNLAGAIGITGWALSLNTVSTVTISRNSVTNEQPAGRKTLGTGFFIAGARPDVAKAYPNYPNNNYGWGMQILTNELPDSNGDGGVGNGTYVLYATACDPYGNCADLIAGGVTISVNNAGSVLPFGTIDTPGQGGQVNGSPFVNFGWALTPQPNIIPQDGSTIKVWVNGQPVQSPSNPVVYNQCRADVDTTFPGLRNSGSTNCSLYPTPGPVGYYMMDSTKLSNGLYTLSWSVTDSAGHTAGIGSRFFTVNGTTLGTNMACGSEYSDIAPDGVGNMHTWSVITDNYTNLASGCAPPAWNTTFIHQYAASVKITSPSGRTSNGATSGSNSAGHGQGTATANDLLAIDGEVGNFTTSGQDTITCSIAGQFFFETLAALFNIPPPVITSVLDSATQSNSVAASTSGQLNIAGSGLTANGVTPSPAISGDDANITFSLASASASQVGVSYAIGTSARVGTHSIHITTAGGQATGTYNVCQDPSVQITTRPMTLTGAFPDTGLPYYATLSASGGPSGGTYAWTTSNSSMIRFTNATVPTVNITVSTAGSAQITVTYRSSCGVVARDSLTFVLTNDITAVGWIDGGAIQLPAGASSPLINQLNTPYDCVATVFSWVQAGMGVAVPPPSPPVTTTIDRQYASAWLNQRAANFSPPSTLPNNWQTNTASYRAFNRFKAYYETTSLGITASSVHYLQDVADIGTTPEPCSGGQVFNDSAEVGILNGHVSTGPSGTGVPTFYYQLNEGRAGSNVQAANTYLNHPEDIGAITYTMSLPFIWSAIQFDVNGNLIPFTRGNTMQIFPSFNVYFNQVLSQQLSQDLWNFLPLTWTSVYVLP